jgi:hypothetical protein
MEPTEGRTADDLPLIGPAVDGRAFTSYSPTCTRCAAYSVRETGATGWFPRAEMSGLPLHSGIQRWLDEPASG